MSVQQWYLRRSVDCSHLLLQLLLRSLHHLVVNRLLLMLLMLTLPHHLAVNG